MLKKPSTTAAILTMPDVLAAAELYERAFDFRRLRYFDGNEEYLVLGRGDAQIHLAQFGSATPHHLNGGHVADVFCWVTDLAPILASARAAGLPVRRGPDSYDSTPVATTEVVFEVPDGYWFCFATADRVHQA
ncbi:MAG: VOC family protein [Propionibacteriales bacterium]|nr:VOC family protein [Propionibacteriales bacterium]